MSGRRHRMIGSPKQVVYMHGHDTNRSIAVEASTIRVDATGKLELTSDGSLPISTMQLQVHSPLYEAYTKGYANVIKLDVDEAVAKFNAGKQYEVLKVNQHATAGTSHLDIPLSMYNPKQFRNTRVVECSVNNSLKWYGIHSPYYNENPFKVAGLMWSPTMMNYCNERSTVQYMDVLLVGPQHVADGTPFFDGCIATTVNFMIDRYRKDIPVGERKFKHVGALQWRPTIAGAQKHGLFKAKSQTLTEREFNSLLTRFGYPELKGKVNSIACAQHVFKTWPRPYKEGEVIRMHINDDMRVVNVKVSSGTSSIGAQSIRLDSKMTESLYLEKEADKNSVLLKQALSGACSAYQTMLKADEDGSLGDYAKEYVQYLCFGKPVGSEWRIRMFESQYRHNLVRCLSFYQRQCIKVRCSKFSFKVAVDPQLDIYQDEHKQLTGKLVNYVRLPRTDKLKDVLAKHQHINIGRSPMVGPGNIQGCYQLVINDVPQYSEWPDTIFVSASMWFSMFGDEDGDDCTFIPSNVAFYPVVRRTPPTEKDAWKDKFLPELERPNLMTMVKQLICCMKDVTQAQIDTGRVDLFTRRYLTAAKLQGKVIPTGHLLKLAEFCEMAIQSMKRKGGKTADAGDVVEDEDVLETIAKEFFEGIEVPKDLREYALLTRKGGFRPDDENLAASDTLVMQHILKVLQSPMPFCKDIPQHVVLDNLQGAKSTRVDKDSLELKQYFNKKWDQIQPILKAGTWGFTDRRIIALCEGVPKMGADGNPVIVNGYVERTNGLIPHQKQMSAKYKNIKDTHDRRTAYTKLSDAIHATLKKNEPSFTTPDEHGRNSVYFYYYALAIYCGSRCFGMGGREDGGTWAGSGGLFWYMPLDTLVDIATEINPDNPYCMKARKELPDIMFQAELRRAAREAASSDEDNADEA